jgi:hypothetical protein
MARGDGLSDLALDLYAQMVCQHEILAGRLYKLADCKGCRQGWCGRMSEQAINAVLGDGQLRVVIVVCMDADTVGEGCKAWCNLAATADNGRSAIGQAQIIQMPAHQFAALGN